LFSHWQVWITCATVLQFSALVLNRYGKKDPLLQESVTKQEQKLANSRL